MTFRHVFTHPAAHPLKLASTTEEIRTTCALDWQILETPVTYAPPQLENEAVFAVEDCKVLYRSDTLLPLAIVPSRFNPAQPEEVIDFYLRFAAHYSLPLVSAGCLQGGKLIWGLVQTGHHFELESRYHAWSHLLLSTRCDSSFAATLSGLCVLESPSASLPTSLIARAPTPLPYTAEFLTPVTLMEIATCRVESELFLASLQHLAAPLPALTAAEYLSAVLGGRTESARHGKGFTAKAANRVLASINSNSRSHRSTTALDLVVAVADHMDNHSARSTSAYDRLHSAWFGAGALRKQTAMTLAFEQFR